MEQYLIIIDLDGTTLNDDKTINSITLKAIEQVSLLGHKVVI